jgi:hypothetical protein
MANEPSASSHTGKLQIEVFGADLDGRQFIEQTRTLTITRDGATIPLANKLAPESELIVRNPATNEEAAARVVGHIRDDAPVHVYGITFINASVNLWGVQFPEVVAQRLIVMECSRCHTVQAVSLSEIETEIVKAVHALTRRCQCSNSSTIWKRTDRDVSEQQAPVPPPVRERPETVAPEDRRKEKRTAMKAAACIRRYGGEVIVECEDMSRGGFRFKSRKAYPVGARIEAAVPYAKGSVNIFITAQIAYQQELSGGFFRHGVAYVKSIKKSDSRS